MNWLEKWAIRLLMKIGEIKQSKLVAQQGVHFLLAAMVVLVGGWIGTMIAIAVVLFLEMWFDPRFERNETKVRGEDVIDMLVYAAGIVVGWLLR